MKHKPVWVCRRDYLRVSDAFCKINREVGEHLEALHDAMRRRDAMRPKYENARKAIDSALHRRAH